MRRDDVRFAVAAREDGLRRVRRLTFRIGAAGVACSAAIAVAFSHLSGSAAASGPAADQRDRRVRAGRGQRERARRVARFRAPGSEDGRPAGRLRSRAARQQGGGSLQVPAQNVAPAQGPAQGVSGGS